MVAAFFVAPALRCWDRNLARFLEEVDETETLDAE
jgi:hypothetical protein